MADEPHDGLEQPKPVRRQQLRHEGVRERVIEEASPPHSPSEQHRNVCGASVDAHPACTSSGAPAATQLAGKQQYAADTTCSLRSTARARGKHQQRQGHSGAAQVSTAGRQGADVCMLQGDHTESSGGGSADWSMEFEPLTDEVNMSATQTGLQEGSGRKRQRHETSSVH